MLTLKFIRDHEALVRERLATRCAEIPLDKLLKCDQQRRELLSEVEHLRAERNNISRRIGDASNVERPSLIDQTRELTAALDTSDPKLSCIEAEIDRLLLEIPMLPHESVPIGDSNHPGEVRFASGAPPAITASWPTHVEIAEALGILDFSRSARISGSGFWIYRGAGARLQRALIQWMLDLQTRDHGYRELYMPALVTESAMRNAGKLPKFAADAYHIDSSRLWLSPTAEVSLAEYHAGETLEATQLPAKYVAYAPAFRQEAGAAGTETRGLRRVHQFDKIELFNLTVPEDSYTAIDRMCAEAEAAIQGLGLTYRIREVPSGDLGFAAAKQYDLEVWSPGAADWLEVSSVSNCEAFQTRRSGIRLRRSRSSSSEYVHSLNGTALGLPRTYVALLENGHQPNGTVVIPEVLRPYMDGCTHITAEPV